MALVDIKLSLKKEDIIKNKMSWMGIGIFFLFLWYGYNMVYAPMAGAMRRVNVEVAKENANLGVSKRLATLQQKTYVYQKRFAKETGMLWLVDKVSRAANETGLKITTLNSKPLVPLKSFLYSSVSLVVTGTFHDLGDFVSKIEGPKEFMRIEKLSFEKDKEFLKAELVISTYFSK